MSQEHHGERESVDDVCVFLLHVSKWQQRGGTQAERALKKKKDTLGRSQRPTFCPQTHTHKGSKFVSPGVQSFGENSRRHGGRKTKHTHRESHEIKTYRLSGITEKKKTKCHRPYSLNWEKKKIKKINSATKKSHFHRLWLMAMFCVSFFDSQLQILKTKQNKKKKNKQGPASTSVSHTEHYSLQR